jgi:hypothetical protein
LPRPVSGSVRGLLGEFVVEPFEFAVEAGDLFVEVGDSPGCDEAGAEVEGRDRFGEVVVGAGFHAFEHVFVFAERCRENDVGVAAVGAVADASAQFGSVESRHHPVGDEHVGWFGLEL